MPDVSGSLTFGHGRLLAGTITVGTAATALTDQLSNEVLIQADPDNVVDVFVGGSAAQPFQLLPGASLVLTVSNLSIIWAKTPSSTAVLNWLALL